MRSIRKFIFSRSPSPIKSPSRLKTFRAVPYSAMKLYSATNDDKENIINGCSLPELTPRSKQRQYQQQQQQQRMASPSRSAIWHEDPAKLFVAAMNSRAHELGMTHTHYANPHGLMAKGFWSCARDAALVYIQYIDT